MLDDQIQHGPEGVRKDTLIDKLTGYPEEGRMISESRQPLDGIIQEGARRMLQEALEIEVEGFLSRVAVIIRPSRGDTSG